MSSTVVMPMPMRSMGAVAPYARVRGSWQRSLAPVSFGFGLGLGSPAVCVTTENDQNTGIDTKAHVRRPQETST
ncbi:MAG TPA: hypothetical protein VM262_16825 [Acidimicrobiales bacterium]|nr:hypothetical protein [Acidimicrobiales bacterium]